MCVRKEEQETHLKKVRQHSLSGAKVDTAKGIPAPPLTFLSLRLCQSALEDKSLFNSPSSWAVTHSDSQSSGVLLQVTHRSFPPCCSGATPGGDVLHQTVLQTFNFLIETIVQTRGDTVGGEREEVEMKHERRDDREVDIV